MSGSCNSLKLENQMCFPLYAASREVVKMYRPHLEKLNLTYTQYIALAVLWENKKCSVKELGKKLYLDSGTLTPVLKSLEQKGFVTRYRSPEDERVLLVELTESGEALQETAEDIPDQVKVCLKLEPEEAKTLYTLLYKLLNNI